MVLGAGAVPAGDTARAESLRFTWGKATGQANWEKWPYRVRRCGRHMGHGIKRQGFCSRCDDKSLEECCGQDFGILEEALFGCREGNRSARLEAG